MKATELPVKNLTSISKSHLYLINFLDGVGRKVYLINGQQPGPLIEAEEGDELEIFVQNDLPVEQTIHWHGQSLTARNNSRKLTQKMQVFCRTELQTWTECRVSPRLLNSHL